VPYPQRLGGVFTTRRYTKLQIHVYLYLTFAYFMPMHAPVVEQNVRCPDTVRCKSNVRYVTEVCLVPRQLVIFPYLQRDDIQQKYNNLVYEQVYSSNKTVRQTERQQYMHIYIIRRHSIHIKTTVNAEKN